MLHPTDRIPSRKCASKSLILAFSFSLATIFAMQSKATTVEQYLAELPEDRRAAIQAVRQVILQNLDKDYEEGMSYGMIGYYVPHRVFPPGYHCNPKLPLPFAGLGSQKNHMSIGLMTIYGDQKHQREFLDAWAKTGKKLDMGKCCIRFKKAEDLALDVIGDEIRRVPASAYIAHYQAALNGARTNMGAPKRTSPGKPRATAKRTTAKAKSSSSKKPANAKKISKTTKAKKSSRPVAKKKAKKPARR